MDPESQLWIDRLRSEEPARGEALEDLREMLLRRLGKTFRDRGDVSSGLLEDVVQDSLLQVLANLDRFEGRSRFATWATTIAVNAVFSELKRKRWKDVSLDTLMDSESGSFTPEGVAATDSGGGDLSLIDDMYRVINEQLTDRQREALLAELKGMPIQEIARNAGSNTNAIYKLTHDARKRLKQGLEALGYSSEDFTTLTP